MLFAFCANCSVGGPMQPISFEILPVRKSSCRTSDVYNKPPKLSVILSRCSIRLYYNISSNYYLIYCCTSSRYFILSPSAYTYRLNCFLAKYLFFSTELQIRYKKSSCDFGSTSLSSHAISKLVLSGKIAQVFC
jgi:hypothetical protein